MMPWWFSNDLTYVGRVLYRGWVNGQLSWRGLGEGSIKLHVPTVYDYYETMVVFKERMTKVVYI